MLRKKGLCKYLQATSILRSVNTYLLLPDIIKIFFSNGDINFGSFQSFMGLTSKTQRINLSITFVKLGFMTKKKILFWYVNDFDLSPKILLRFYLTGFLSWWTYWNSPETSSKGKKDIWYISKDSNSRGLRLGTRICIFTKSL